jgi:hypothetical protein
MKKIRMVTLRVKKEVAIEYKKILIDAHESVTQDLSEHINKQVHCYTLINSKPMPTIQKEYVQLGFRVDDEIYTEYKKVLVENGTNTTADCIRHILKTIEERKPV